MAARFGEVTLSRILAEAIEHSPAVRRLVIDHVAPRVGWKSSGFTAINVHHGYVDSALDARETDILLSLSSGADTQWVLIEVKINAPFGCNQPQDYARRKDKAVELKRCGQCATMVIAPHAYLRAHPVDVNLFDAALCLESLRLAPTLDVPAELLATRINIALDLFAAGYIPLKDALRQAQIAWYDAFVQGYKPHLVPNPTNAGKQTRDRFFPVPGQSRGYITHRIFAGEVSAGFMQRGHRLRDLRSALIASGDSDADLEVRGTSIYVRLRNRDVRPIDEAKGFADQEAIIRSALNVIHDLHQWCDRHRKTIGMLVADSFAEAAR